MNDALEVANLVKRADEAAFAVDWRKVVIAWNLAAKHLLGWGECEVLGARCYEIICGRDLFGNRFCGQDCPLASMACQHEPVRHFELGVRSASGAAVRVAVSAIVVQGLRLKEFTIIHILEPVTTQLPGCDPPPKMPVGTADPSASTLTPREVQILRFVETGAETAEIAARLCISVKTVRNHIQNLFSKLGAHNRLEAICAARRKSVA